MKRRVFFLGKGNFQGKEKKKMQHEKTTGDGTLVGRGDPAKRKLAAPNQEEEQSSTIGSMSEINWERKES